MILYILLCAVGMILLEPVLGTVCLISALLMFAYYRHMSYQKFGGITGDLAGFFLQVCELVMAAAVVIAAKIIGL